MEPSTLQNTRARQQQCNNIGITEKKLTQDMLFLQSNNWYWKVKEKWRIMAPWLYCDTKTLIQSFTYTRMRKRSFNMNEERNKH